MTSTSIACPVCREPYNPTDHKPLILTCGHSFCSSCISHMQGSGTVACPVCRRLYLNLQMKDIPVCYQLMPEDEASVQRELKLKLCSEHQLKILFWCVTCEELVCMKCVENDHAGCTMIIAETNCKRIREVGEARALKRSEERETLQSNLENLSTENSSIVTVLKGFKEMVDNLLQNYIDQQKLIDSQSACLSGNEKILKKSLNNPDEAPAEAVVMHYAIQQAAMKSIRTLKPPASLKPTALLTHILNFKEPCEQFLNNLSEAVETLRATSSRHLQQLYKRFPRPFKSSGVEDIEFTQTAGELQPNNQSNIEQNNQGNQSNLHNNVESSQFNVQESNAAHLAGVWKINNASSAEAALLTLQSGGYRPREVVIEVTERLDKLDLLLPVVAQMDCDVKLRNFCTNLSPFAAFFRDEKKIKCRLVQLLDLSRYTFNEQILRQGGGNLRHNGISYMNHSWSYWQQQSQTAFHVFLTERCEARNPDWKWPPTSGYRHVHFNCSSYTPEIEVYHDILVKLHPWTSECPSRIWRHYLAYHFRHRSQGADTCRWALHLPTDASDIGKCSRVLRLLRKLKSSQRPCFVYLRPSPQTMDKEDAWLLQKRFCLLNIHLKIELWLEQN